MSRERTDNASLLTPEQISSQPRLVRLVKALGGSDNTAWMTASIVTTAGLWVLGAPFALVAAIRNTPSLSVLVNVGYESVSSLFNSPAAPNLDLNEQAPNAQSPGLNRNEVSPSPSSDALLLANQARLSQEQVLESEHSAAIKSRIATGDSTVISTTTRQSEQKFRSPGNGESAHDVDTVKYN